MVNDTVWSPSMWYSTQDLGFRIYIEVLGGSSGGHHPAHARNARCDGDNNAYERTQVRECM